MSWRDSLPEARARLAALEAAETKVLIGEQVARVSYEGGGLDYAKGATLTEIRQALRETQLVVNRLAGGRRTGGAFVPVLGR
jgi:hypothetical protein